MLVYRITHKKFSEKLVASGIENRWNYGGQFVVYSAESKAMACLENLVHTNAETLWNDLYICMEIFIPETAGVTAVSLNDLPQNFTGEEQKAITREIGNKWYTAGKDLLLKVPSAIISTANNIIINAMHDEFKQVKIARREPFNFDSRLKK